MANITKRVGKNETISYRIRVFAGVDLNGKQIFRSKTFVPDKGMTARQIEKALTRAVVDFEQEVQQGVLGGAELTVDEFMEKWIHEYAERQLKAKTVADYKKLIPRISAALGHIRLDKLRPGHILQFYDQLAQPGIRLDAKYKARQALLEKCPADIRKVIAKTAGVSKQTAARVWAGESVSLTTAQKVAEAAGVPFSKAFVCASKTDVLSGSSAQHYHRLLSSALSTAVKWQLIDANPCTRVSPPKAEDHEIQFLDEQGISALMEALPDVPVQYSVITQLALFTGARRGELCALRWSDVDLQSGVLTIRRTLVEIPGEGLIFNEPKTKKSKRVIRLGQNAIQLLTNYKKWQAEERFKYGSKWLAEVEIMGQRVKNDLLFTSGEGKPMRPGSVTGWFSKFLRTHGLPQVRFHSLRHSNASLLIAAHVPVVTVAGRLGHAQVSTTTNIYAGFIKSSDAKAADSLEEAFDRLGNTERPGGNGQSLVKFDSEQECTG